MVHVRALPLGVLDATDLCIVVKVAPLVRGGLPLVNLSIFEGRLLILADGRSEESLFLIGNDRILVHLYELMLDWLRRV
jgi:hypothetical protein